MGNPRRELKNAQARLNDAAGRIAFWVKMFPLGGAIPRDHEAIRDLLDAWDEFDALRKNLEGAGATSPRDTSIAAGVADLPAKGSTRRLVISTVVLNYRLHRTGMTVAELCSRLRKPHQTVSSAVNFAEERGWLRDSGQRRKTSHNREAIVFAPTELAIAACIDSVLSGEVAG